MLTIPHPSFALSYDPYTRRLLDNYVNKWDYRDINNLFYEDAVTREASRAKWRNFYKAKSVFDLRQIQVAPGGVPPVQPDQLDDPILEPP